MTFATLTLIFWLRPNIRFAHVSLRRRIIHRISDTTNDPFPKQPFGPYQQEAQSQHVREPAFDPASDFGTQIYLGQLLRRADYQPGEYPARHGRIPAENQPILRVQLDERQRELHASV